MLELPIQLLCHDLPYPTYALPESSGLDLCASVANEMLLLPGKRLLVPTGIKIEIPPGYEGQVRPRSGLALHYGIGILNSPGTIDSSYRGEIQVILIHLGEEPFTVRRGMRIAQLVIAPVVQAIHFVPRPFLSDSIRKDKGFGSTGM